jgi:hypothetical protein
MRRLRVLLLLLGLCLVGAADVGTADTGQAQEWVAPVEPTILRRPFDPPEHRWEPGHRGVDLAGEVGQEVVAAGDGEVVYAGDLAGRGVVSVRHGALRTTYEPVDASVVVGEPVSRGEVIGRLQGGHRGAGPVLDQALLHWGLLRGETYLDPMSLLRPVRVRLLPRWSATAAPAPRAATPRTRLTVSGAPTARPAPPPRSATPRARLTVADAPKARQRPAPVAAVGVVAASGLGLALALRRV